MAKPKSLPQHRCYDWSSGDHRSIEIRLAAQRDEIASILQVDPTERQAVRITDKMRPTGRSVSAYIARRNGFSGFELVSRLQLVLDDIKGALVRFVAELSNVNERASENVVRTTLEAVAARQSITEEEVELLDLSVRERLAKHYPSGAENFKPGALWPEFVIEAAQSALRDIEKPKRGRPKGSINQAADTLGRELVAIFSSNSPAPPARSVVNRKSKGAIMSSVEGGDLLKFFECVIDALPDDYRERVTKSGGDLPSLVRRSLSPGT